jgi:hypothetical protein
MIRRFAASALHGELDDPAPSLGDEVRWVKKHPLAAATGGSSFHHWIASVLLSGMVTSITV